VTVEFARQREGVRPGERGARLGGENPASVAASEPTCEREGGRERESERERKREREMERGRVGGIEE